MEVLVGPTFSIEVSTVTPAYVRERNGGSAQDKVAAAASSCIFLREEEEGGSGLIREGIGSVIGMGSLEKSLEDSSNSSSSIGAAGDSEAEEDDDDHVVSSKARDLGLGSLGSFGSLEDSLPIKRGLSNHYSGRSKSFANLSDVSTVKDLEKADNSFNKRRRVLMANKLSKRSSFYSWQNPKSMPLLALKEDDDDEEDGEVNNPTWTSSSSSSPSNYEDVGGKRGKLQNRRQLVVKKYQSCFSLTDEEPQLTP